MIAQTLFQVQRLSKKLLITYLLKTGPFGGIGLEINMAITSGDVGVAKQNNLQMIQSVLE